MYELGWVLLGAGVAAILIGLIGLALLAPEGYEDEKGFHYGEDPNIERRLIELERLRAAAANNG